MLLEEVLIYTKLSICSRLCMNPINSSLVVEGWQVCPDCGRICGTSTAIMPFTQDSEQQDQTPSRARMPWTQRRSTEMPWFLFRKSKASSIFVIFGVSLELAMTSHKSANDPPTPHWPWEEGFPKLRVYTTSLPSKHNIYSHQNPL